MSPPLSSSNNSTARKYRPDEQSSKANLCNISSLVKSMKLISHPRFESLSKSEVGGFIELLDLWKIQKSSIVFGKLWVLDIIAPPIQGDVCHHSFDIWVACYFDVLDPEIGEHWTLSTLLELLQIKKYHYVRPPMMEKAQTKERYRTESWSRQ